MTLPASRLLVFGLAAPSRDQAVEKPLAFDEVYARLAPKVHRFLVDLLQDRALAADATQETFVRALRALESRPEGVRVTAWVFGIARNVSLELRKTRRRTVLVSCDDERSSPERSPEAQLLDREALAIVARALGKLPEGRRAALLLRFDHGLAYDDIAQAMGWSLAKTKIEIHRARETLRATYDEYRGGRHDGS